MIWELLVKFLSFATPAVRDQLRFSLEACFSGRQFWADLGLTRRKSWCLGRWMAQKLSDWIVQMRSTIISERQIAYEGNLLRLIKRSNQINVVDNWTKKNNFAIL